MTETALPLQTLSALRSSVDRLQALVAPLDDAAITTQAYAREWKVADVMSHLGSGAVIFGRGFADTLAGGATPDDFNQGVWDAWNAKSARAKTVDALLADEQFTAQLESTSDDDRASFRTTFGPFEVDFDGFTQMRLNEHLLHEWDIAVAFDPTATLADDGAALVVGAMDMIVGWTGKPQGGPRTISITTSGDDTTPRRSFELTIGERVTLVPVDVVDDPEVTMPTEALVRLVYGRLDPDHTPASVRADRATLDLMRAIFPGP